MSIQNKFKQANHIYKITTDIDLKGQLLTIPENCTLDFQGGSFNNGTIKFNNTQLLNIQSFDDIGNNIIKDPSSTYHIGQLLYDPSSGNYKIWTGRGLAPITYNIIKEDTYRGNFPNGVQYIDNDSGIPILGLPNNILSLREVTPTTKVCVYSVNTNGDKLEKNLSWQPINIQDLVSFGVAWNSHRNIVPGQPVPLCRVGLYDNPIFSNFYNSIRGCIYNAITREVVYWLDKDNWEYKDGHNPNKGEVQELSRLDGYDGEVMIYFPKFYIKAGDEQLAGVNIGSGKTLSVRVSPVKIDDTWVEQPETFVSAFRNTILSEVPTNMGYLSLLPVGSAISVKNSTSYCRGGDRSVSTETQNQWKSNLGKCVTNITRDEAREAAKKGHKDLMSYLEYIHLLYWLPVIEMANFNCQSPAMDESPDDVLGKKGLSEGITTLPLNIWQSINNFNPIIKNGTSAVNSHKVNISQVVLYPIDSDTGASPILHATSWRGIEDPFGHIDQILDYVIVRANIISNVETGKTYGEVIILDPYKMAENGDTMNDNPRDHNTDMDVTMGDNPRNTDMGDNSQNYKKDSIVAQIRYEETSGYIENVCGEEDNQNSSNVRFMIPSSVKEENSSQCKYSDFFTHHFNGSQENAIISAGGYSIDGDRNGLACFSYEHGINDKESYLGFRTVIRPQIPHNIGILP